MTTPDANKGGGGQASPPGEPTLGAAQVPRHGETPQLPTAAAGSTPGIALAGARVPGGPSLPELDPMSLTRLVSELANQLFAAPPNTPGAPTTLADAETFSSPPPAPSPPTSDATHGAPITIGDPSPASATPTSPFGTTSAPYASAPNAAQWHSSPSASSPTATSPGSTSSYSTPYANAPGATSAYSANAPGAAHSSSAQHATAPHAGSTPPANAPYAAASPPASPHATKAATPTPTARPAGTQGSSETRAFDGTSPFLAPLDADAIARLSEPFGVAPSVGDPRSASPVPDLPGIAPPTGITFDTFEIVPTNDALVRSLTPFDANVIKRDFPILHEPVRGKRLVWLDNAATTQKPKAVIDRLSYFYEHENSNIHRAAHTLAARATDAYESARETVRRFIHAPSAKDVVFVRGTTEAINLVAQSWGRRNVNAGDEIVITWLEHHANIVPWQQLCSEKGAKLRVAPVDSRGQVILEEYEKLLGPKTKLVSFTQVSNALGTITPAKEMIEMAHRHGAVVLLDGAQSVSHMPVDVQLLGCDFFVFSGHKVFAPTGIGVVWGRSEILEAMPPWQGGGNMIQDVTFERTLYQGPPARFEAGTGNIADAVGLGAALEWLSRVGVERVERYEHELLVYATEKLMTVPGLTLVGTAPHKAGVLSFVLDGQKTEEVGGILDQDGIAVRSGHHCAQPILRRFGYEATVRASLAPYNTCEDIDALVDALRKLQTGHAAPR